MLKIALTGGIGTGKSTTLAMIAERGVPTLSADAAVHQLLKKSGAGFEVVASAFPEAVTPEGVDRKNLGDIVFADETKLKQLEAILHPLVREAEDEFLKQANVRGEPVAVIEIPLLFEAGEMDRFDKIITTTAPTFIKWARVKNRPHMTKTKFNAIVKRQIPDAQKCKMADFVIHTWLGKSFVVWQVGRIFSRSLR